MAASIPAGGRIRLADVQAGDLVFFGPRGRKTPPRLIGHVGLALGNGWFVHASVRGVTLDRLDGSVLPRELRLRAAPAGGSSDPAAAAEEHQDPDHDRQLQTRSHRERAPPSRCSGP